MINWAKKFLFDETAFVGLVRGLLLVTGLMADQGKLPLPSGYEWIGLVIVGLAGFIRAGEKNGT